MTGGASLRLVRFMDQPLLRVGDHPKIGQNINGPCVIRVPDWLGSALGRFYMYFAHHTGTFIKLAVSDDLQGPWRMIDRPPLHVSETGFAQGDVTHRLPTGERITEPAHIASPDVHVLNVDRKIAMLFHGLKPDGSQTTRLALSDDGLSFSTDGFESDLAPPYLRLCRFEDHFIGVAWGGEMFASDSIFGPFHKGPSVLERPNGAALIPRHPALFVKDGQLQCLYSLIGDSPEQLWHVTLMRDAYSGDWQIGEPAKVLTPKFHWEGANLPIVPSAIGTATGLENAVRDPFVFEDHLFYVAGGESAIAVARIEWF